MKGNVSKGASPLALFFISFIPIDNHKRAESKNKLEIKIQLNIPLNFFFFSSCHLRSTLSSTLLSMQPAWAWGLVPSVRWPGRCYVRPAWINHVCARLRTSLWIHHGCTSGKQHGGKYPQKWKWLHKKPSMEMPWNGLTHLHIFNTLQTIYHLSLFLPSISFDVWNERV